MKTSFSIPENAWSNISPLADATWIGELLQRGSPQTLRPWDLAHEPAAWKRLLVDHTDLAPHSYEASSLVAIISLQLREDVQ